MNSATKRTMAPGCATPAAREHFHPLEIIPFFRRFPRSVLRDVIYTFIWNCLFGLTFYTMGAFSSGRLPSFQAFGIFLLVSNFVGYSIHLLYSLGAVSGLEALARRGGFTWRAAYYMLVPVIGVFLGFWLASFVVDVGLRQLLTNLNLVLAILSISLVISLVLSVIFFWRERSAVADAALAQERERAERIERQAAFANLRALQAQIEPHFLFNTLANVASLIEPDPARARRMLESFIHFLRASLTATRTETMTLGAEGELIAAYLGVLQVRMGARLRYRIEIDPGVRAFGLPPMLLQPVVENAITHGLEPKVEGGEVVFRATREGDHVRVEIADTGVGFAATTRGGLGLGNLRDRLKLLYGERGSLTIRENSPSGAVVTLRIPA